MIDFDPNDEYDQGWMHAMEMYKPEVESLKQQILALEARLGASERVYEASRK